MADHSKWKGKNLSYMTPQMMHALKMSQTQSQNNYKKSYNETVKGKGSSGSSDTVEGQRVKKLTEQSLLNYHKDFENTKAKGYTTVTETPELSRIRGQESYRDVHYKKDFMDQKGHNIPVTETPESNRVKKQQQFLSDIKYQEDRTKLRGKATQIVDDPQTIRAMQAARIASDVEYKKNKEKTEEMERRRQEMTDQHQRTGMQAELRTSRVAPARHPAFYQKNVVRGAPMKRWRRQPGSIFDYDPSDYDTEEEFEAGLASRIKAHAISRPYHTDTEADFVKVATWQPKRTERAIPWTDYLTGKAYKHVAAPGSVMDYDPVQRMQQMNLQNRPREEPAPIMHASPPQSPKQIQQETFKAPEPEPVETQQQLEPEEFVRKADGHVYQAMYDYIAQDDDEVTFMDGDVIINAQKIDDGWMFGTVQRTGQTGMLPFNYVNVVQ